jgi:hypothetical protein
MATKQARRSRHDLTPHPYKIHYSAPQPDSHSWAGGESMTCSYAAQKHISTLWISSTLIRTISVSAHQLSGLVVACCNPNDFRNRQGRALPVVLVKSCRTSSWSARIRMDTSMTVNDSIKDCPSPGAHHQARCGSPCN